MGAGSSKTRLERRNTALRKSQRKSIYGVKAKTDKLIKDIKKFKGLEENTDYVALKDRIYRLEGVLQQDCKHIQPKIKDSFNETLRRTKECHKSLSDKLEENKIKQKALEDAELEKNPPIWYRKTSLKKYKPDVQQNIRRQSYEEQKSPQNAQTILDQRPRRNSEKHNQRKEIQVDVDRRQSYEEQKSPQNAQTSLDQRPRRNSEKHNQRKEIQVEVDRRQAYERQNSSQKAPVIQDQKARENTKKYNQTKNVQDARRQTYEEQNKTLDPKARENGNQTRNAQVEVAADEKENQSLEILDVHQYFRDDVNLNSLNGLDKVEQIRTIGKWAKTFEDKVRNFKEAKYSLEYFILDEKLMRFVERLDKIKCKEEPIALQEKVKVIEKIKNLHRILDERAIED